MMNPLFKNLMKRYSLECSIRNATLKDSCPLNGTANINFASEGSLD